MNASSIKTVLVLAVLGAVGYGVYVKLNNGPDNTAPPKGADGWSAQPPKIELSGVGTTAPTFPGAPGGTAAEPGVNAGRPFTLNIPGPGQSGPKDNLANQGGATPLPSYPGRVEVSSGPGNTASGGRASADPFPSAGAGPWSNSASASPSVGIGPASPEVKGNPFVAPGASAGSTMGNSGANDEVRKAFAALMDAAMVKLSKGELAEVHLTLSEWYGDPRLPSDQASQLTELLSQLAGTVIYSQQSFLERPYVVRFGDSLESIALAYHVPPQMLANINNIRNPNDLQPGQELKVVRGPFNAILDLSRYELVLMLDGRYAGRFPIGVGRDCPPLERQYVVRDKKIVPAAYSATQDPSKSQGNRWIDLGGGVGIHGTDAPQSIGRNDGQGAIFMSERDVADLYDILTAGTNGSNGSAVIVRR